MSMHEGMDLGHQGAKRSSWAKMHYRDLALKICEEHPKLGVEQLAELLMDELKKYPDYMPSIAIYIMANIKAALTYKNRDSGSEPLPSLERRIIKQVAAKAMTALLAMQMPNGKTLAKSTGAECIAAGGWLAGLGEGDGVLLLHTVLATALVASGASALNQLFERHTDALMRRTENRPLPAGRLHPTEALIFGLGLSIAGLVYMAVAGRQPLAVALTAFTFAAYVWLYTPLKRVTTLNTLVGAVPGALPPVIGWTAVRGSVGSEAVVMFLILFLWQLPHFLAIAWIYRGDYARAGLRMLPVVDTDGTSTARKMVSFCAALVAVSFAPVVLHQAGVAYILGAIVLGWIFLGSTLRFARECSLAHARRVLRASLLYLPLLLALWLLEEIGSSVALAWTW